MAKEGKVLVVQVVPTPVTVIKREETREENKPGFYLPKIENAIESSQFGSQFQGKESKEESNPGFFPEVKLKSKTWSN